jgi:hypothetical protein
LAPVRCQGIRVLAYLDDWLVVADLREHVELHAAMLVYYIQSLGFTMNHKRSCLTLARCVQFLGLVLDTVLNHAFVSTEGCILALSGTVSAGALSAFSLVHAVIGSYVLYDSGGNSGTSVDVCFSTG